MGDSGAVGRWVAGGLGVALVAALAAGWVWHLAAQPAGPSPSQDAGEPARVVFELRGLRHEDGFAEPAQSRELFPLLVRGARAPPALAVEELEREQDGGALFTPEEVTERGVGEDDLARAAATPGRRLVFSLVPGAREQLRQAEALVSAWAAANHALVWDSLTGELFSAEQWQERRVDTWAGEVPKVPWHVMVQMYSNDDGSRSLVTDGMSRFELPELRVDGVPRSDVRAMDDLLNVAIQALVEQGSHGGSLGLDLNKLRHPAFREEQLSACFPNAQHQATVRLALDPDDGVIDLVFRQSDREDETVRQEAALQALFGASADPISRVEHTPAILAASARAKRRISGELKRRFGRGLSGNEVLLLKAPFLTSGGGNEWMWVEVSQWRGARVTGILQNDPEDVPDLSSGATVQIKEAEVFDYILHCADGGTEGNETGKLMLQQEGAAR